MTNLEWIRHTVSAEELIEIEDSKKCCMCIYQGAECTKHTCVDGRIAWLKAEHITELKPCPFCGAVGDFINHDSSVFWVQCTNCGSHGRQSKTKNGAIRAWNRRVENEADKV